MSKFKQDFGQMVREVRQHQGLSQDALAASAGMHKNYLGAVERGEYNISLESARKIAKALKVPLSDLVDANEEPASPQSEADRLRAEILKVLRRQGLPKLRMMLEVVKVLAKGRA